MYEQLGADGSVVIPRISADVLDEYIGTFYGKAVYLRVHDSQVATVNVSVDGTQRAESSQPFGHFQRTDVAGVPYFITMLEMLQISVVPTSVCVGQ